MLAIRAWLEDPVLVKRTVLDPDVKRRVDDMVQQASARVFHQSHQSAQRVQRPEWHSSGRTEFVFDEGC